MVGPRENLVNVTMIGIFNTVSEQEKYVKLHVETLSW